MITSNTPVTRPESQALNLVRQIQESHENGDQYAIGIDFAASAKNWGLSVIRIGNDASRNAITAIFPHPLKTADGTDHKTNFCRPTSEVVRSLLQWIADQKIDATIAVDVPFGWPVRHREFLNHFCAASGLESPYELPTRENFERRFCDLALTKRFKDQRVAPLSVSADTLGQAAFSWAVERQKLRELIGFTDIGLSTDRQYPVQCIETYPAAFVRCCFPELADYKSANQIDQRRRLVGRLLKFYDLHPDDEIETWCERACCQKGSPDALDSLLCAFCAWDYDRSQIGDSKILISTPANILKRSLTKTEEATIRSEGWILFRYDA